jgi:cell wall-associated NlpC family hydrolase
VRRYRGILNKAAVTNARGWFSTAIFLSLVLWLPACGGRSAWKGAQDTSSVLRTAKTQLGRPYHYGGTSPQTGFDCSGFTQWVWAQHGVKLPRDVEGQYRTGRKVDMPALKEGDLVFFNINGRGPSHVGLAAGKGDFIHSPSTGGKVRTNSLNQKWWAKRYVGARRVAE